ncbi:hypothetical protein Tco_1391169 [Tanacetum coccineum]
MFARCLTTRATGFDQPPLQIMQIFTKLIVSHYMTAFLEISRRARDKYHNLEDDMMVKIIFNLGKHKDGVGMKIPNVPTTQSQPIESTQGTHRTTSAPRRSTRLTPPTPIPTTAEANDIILQDTIQLSLAEQKSHDKLEAKQNVQKVEKHLIAAEIEKLVEGAEKALNDEVDSTTLRQNDNLNDPDTRTGCFKRYKSFFDELQRCYGYLFEHLKTRFMLRKKFNVLAQHLQGIMEESLPTIVDDRADSSVGNYMLGHILHVHSTQATPTSAQEQQYQLYLTMRDNPQPSAVRPRDLDNPHDDAHPEGENDAKMQKTSEHGTYVFGESSSDDDEIPIEKVSQELMDEMSQTVDEAKLRKVVNEMKEILVSSNLKKPTLVVQSCQRDPKAHALSLVNQDLLYLKKGSSAPEKIVMSLHKFPAVFFPDDDIEERTSR